MLDSGAEATVISADDAESLGLNLTGSDVKLYNISGGQLDQGSRTEFDGRTFDARGKPISMQIHAEVGDVSGGVVIWRKGLRGVA